MEDLDRLGPPQIKLAGLEIWIHRRQFPNHEDFWDGNWLYTTIRCFAPGAQVLASGPIIDLSELERWHDESVHMQNTLSGRANLGCIEPELSVELTASNLGHILMDVEITPDNLNQEHKFKFEIDQSYLNRLLHQLRAVLDEYPIRGERPIAR